MTRQKYSTYLRSAHWRTTRLQALQDGGHKCWACEATRALHVHHKTYERVGCEIPADLVVLCSTCHTLVHRLVKSGRAKLDVAHVEVRRDFQGRIATDDEKVLPPIGQSVQPARRKKRARRPSQPVVKSAATQRREKTPKQLAREERKAHERRLEEIYEDRRAMRRAEREERGRLIA